MSRFLIGGFRHGLSPSSSLRWATPESSGWSTGPLLFPFLGLEMLGGWERKERLSPRAPIGKSKGKWIEALDRLSRQSDNVLFCQFRNVLF